MAFCQNCGSQVDGKFCAKCGAPSGQDAGTAAPPEIPPPASGEAGLADNIAGALCYIPILGVIFLLIEPYSRNKLIRFHAFQSLFLVAAMFVINIALTALFEMFWGVFAFYALFKLVYIGLLIFLALKAFKGEKVVLPVIGPLAAKQA